MSLCNTGLHKDRANRSSSAKDARAVRTDRALRDAFLQLLKEKKLDQITVKEICVKAGIHYVTFFRRYETKEDLLNYVAAGQVDHVKKLSLPILEELDSKSAFVSLFLYINDHRQVWSALLTGGAAATIRETMLDRAKQISPKHRQEGGFLPTDLARACTISSVVECITWWLGEEDAAVSPLEMAEMANTLVQSCIPHNTLFQSPKAVV